MKLAIVAVVLAVCLVQSTEAWWGKRIFKIIINFNFHLRYYKIKNFLLKGGLYGLGYGWGGLYGMYGMGMYGLWGKRATTETVPQVIPEVMNRTECVYTKESSMLSCKGYTGIVECESSLRWDGPIEAALFGIADCEEETPVAPHFRILPRKTDNSAWKQDRFLLNTNEEKRISLFYSDKLNHMGLKVLDETCFEKLTSLLNASERREKVFVGDETAVLRGELTALDIFLQKNTDFNLMIFFIISR